MKPRAATTHSLERTSPKGGPFVGRCVLCGQEGLRSGGALLPCPNTRSVSDAQALIDAINGPPMPGQGPFGGGPEAGKCAPAGEVAP